MEPIERKHIREALARGYCAPANSAKVLDPDLINAMVAEVAALFGVPPEAK